MKPVFRHKVWASVVALSMVAGCSGSKDEQAYLSAAEALLAKRDLNAASIEVKNALHLNPESARARFMLARTLLELEDATGAEVELNKALNLGFNADDVALLRAKLWNTQGRFSATVQEFGTHGLIAADAAAAMEVQLATAQAGLRDWSAAANHVQRALVKVPGYEPARVLAVRVHAAKGEREPAMALAKKLNTESPKSAEVWKLLGDLYRTQDGNAGEVVAAYEKALDLDPTHPDALTALAELYFARGDLSGVERLIGRLRTVAANRTSTLLFEARLASERKDFERARQLLEGMLKVNPNEPRILQAAGAVALARGRNSEAQAFLSKALRIAPDSLQLRHLLAQALIEDGQPAQALNVLEPLVSAGQADAQALALAARANQALGKGDRAAEQLAQAGQKPGASVALQVEAAVAAAQSRGSAPLDVGKLSRIAAQDETVQADVKLIEALIQRKQFADALQAITALDTRTPKSAVPPTLIGRVQLLSGQRDQARKSFATALARDSAHFPALANLAVMDVEERKLPEARKRFEALLQADPGHLQALLTLSDLERMAGSPAAQVREPLATAVKANPRAVEARLALVDHALRQGDVPAALEAAQAANAALPNNVQVLEQLGRVHLMRGQFELARMAFGGVLSLDAKNLGARLGMASALLGLGNQAGATEAVDRAIADTPMSVDALRAGMNVALRGKQYAKVVQYARKVQALRPNEVAGFLMEGQAELLRGGHAAAIQAFTAALKLGDNSDAAAGLHRALSSGQRKADADAFARSWATKHPEDGGFLLKAAEAAIASRDYVGAELVYRQLLERQPRNAVALNNLAMLMMQQNKPGAIAVAQRAVEISPQQSEFADTLAQAYASEKNYTKAIELQRQLVVRAPKTPDYRLNLAKFLIAAHEVEAARGELKQLSELGTTYGRQSEVTKLLQAH